MIPYSLLLTPVAGLVHVFDALRSWQRRRRDQRILDSLSPEQLKDIGYHRLPSGDLERGGW
jgi:uncharacterized protein YjiS (DUF1127 family)